MKAAVVGSGAWGTALAVRLCKNGHDVTMWTYEKDKIPEMLETHHNQRRLRLRQGLQAGGHGNALLPPARRQPGRGSLH